ncbi:hypothetical protein AAVH_34230, partial [Aphelenchoides avenae]
MPPNASTFTPKNLTANGFSRRYLNADFGKQLLVAIGLLTTMGVPVKVWYQGSSYLESMKNGAFWDADLYGSVASGLGFAVVLTSIAYERLTGAVKQSAREHVMECRNRITLFAFFGLLLSGALSLN